MLNKDTSKVYGDPSEYDVKDEVLRFKTTSRKTNRFYESLTIDLDIIRYDAELYLSWENTQIHFPIVTGSHQKALAAIDASLKKSPENQQLLSQASYYYYMNNEDSNQILEWLNRGLAVGEERWLYNQKIDVLERMKNYSEAHKAATTAILYLKRDKPYGWEYDVRDYEARLKKWALK